MKKLIDFEIIMILVLLSATLFAGYTIAKSSVGFKQGLESHLLGSVK